jgi:KipI family sensor histidine kinase inhibitor
MRIRVYGRAALLVELGTLSQVLGLHAELRRRRPYGMVDAVPAARTLLVSFDPLATTAATMAADLRTRPIHDHDADHDAGPEVRIPVCYDGEDLPEVVRLTGWSREKIVRRHRDRTYLVALIGFAPGFYFLTGGDDGLRVPRRHSPRTSVPKGAVALAGEFTGIYPRTGPGGWQLIGRTSAPLWDTTRTPSALLMPGTRVRLIEAER